MEIVISDSDFELNKNRRANIQTGDEDSASCFEISAKYVSLIIAIIIFPISVFFCFRFSYEFQRVVIFRLGRLRKGVRGPGLFFILPCIDECIYTDLRTESINVLPQDVLTKDSVSISLDAVIFFRMVDPISGVVQIDNYRYSTLLLAKSILRNVAGTKMLNELLSHREEVANSLQKILDKTTNAWGVKVERVEIKDVHLPLTMQRSMAAEAEAKREAKAKIIGAGGERAAADALRQASDIMSSSPAAVQLRYMQTLSTISTTNNSTLVVPFPSEFAKTLLKLSPHAICNCNAQPKL